VGVGQIAGLVVKPAVTGSMKARSTKSKQNSVAKKQWVAYVGVALVTTLIGKVLNDFIERRLAPDDADVSD
jgi:hypothetical protein